MTSTTCAISACRSIGQVNTRSSISLTFSLVIASGPLPIPPQGREALIIVGARDGATLARSAPASPCMDRSAADGLSSRMRAIREDAAMLTRRGFLNASLGAGAAMAVQPQRAAAQVDRRMIVDAQV